MRFCHEFESILHNFVHLFFASFKISSLDESIPFEPATFDSILHKFVYFSFVSLDETCHVRFNFVYFSFVSLDESILRLKDRNCYARDSATFDSNLHNFVYLFFVSFKISRRIDISFSIIVGTESGRVDRYFV